MREETLTCKMYWGGTCLKHLDGKICKYDPYVIHPPMEMAIFNASSKHNIPFEEYFMYHLCNSRILVSSLSINSGHIRGSPSKNGFLPAPSWTGAFAFPSSWAFESPISDTNSAIASSSFERTLRSGTLCLGCSPRWGNWLYRRLLFFYHDFVIERS